MLKKTTFLAGLAVLAIALSVVTFSDRANKAEAAPQGITNMKLFNELETAEVEPTVNGWIASQTGIVIDSVDMDSAGNYQIAVGYHATSPANQPVTTRVKLFQLEHEAGTIELAEAEVNAFLASLASTRRVRAVDVAVGLGAFPATLVLYD